MKGPPHKTPSTKSVQMESTDGAQTTLPECGRWGDTLLSFLVCSSVLIWSKIGWMDERWGANELQTLSRLTVLLLWLYAFSFVPQAEGIFEATAKLLELLFPGIVTQAQDTMTSIGSQLPWHPTRLLLVQRLLFEALCVREASLRWTETDDTTGCIISREKSCVLDWQGRLTLAFLDGVCIGSHLPMVRCRKVISHVPFAVATLCVWVAGQLLLPALNSSLLFLQRRKRFSNAGEASPAANFEEQLVTRESGGGDGDRGADEDAHRGADVGANRGIGVPWAMLGVSLLLAVIFYAKGETTIKMSLWDGRSRHEVWRNVIFALSHGSSAEIFCILKSQVLLSGLLHAVFPWRSVILIYVGAVISGSLASSGLATPTLVMAASGGAYGLAVACFAAFKTASLQDSWRLVPVPTDSQWSRLMSFLRRRGLLLLPPLGLLCFLGAVDIALFADRPRNFWDFLQPTLPIVPEPSLETLAKMESARMGGIIGGALITWLLLLRKNRQAESRWRDAAVVSVGVLLGLNIVVNYIRLH